MKKHITTFFKYLVIFLIGFLFRKSFIENTEKLFNQINNILYIDSNSSNDFILFTLIFVAILHIFIKTKYLPEKLSINKNAIELSIFLIILYLYIRYKIGHYYFTQINYCITFYYFDLVFIALLISPIEYLIAFYKNNSYLNNINKNKGYIFSKPETENDNLNRGYLVNEVYKKILNTYDSNESFTIGIKAEWGEGKTTFTNFLKKKLKDHVYIVDFNPWDGHDISIRQHLFEELKNTIPNLVDGIDRYMLATNTVAISQYKLVIIDLLKYLGLYEHSIKNEFRNLNTKINQLSRKVVIFIDDIDRLNSKELIELFSLLRNSSNFGNVIFVINYNKDYIINALNNEKIHNPDKYLEKIMQYEFTLNRISEETLLVIFYDKMKAILTDEDYNILIKPYGPVFNKSKSFVFNSINNIRDINRLVNSIILFYERFKENINIHDLIMASILEIKYYDIYKSIFILRENKYTEFDPAKSHISLHNLSELKNKNIFIDDKSSDLLRSIFNYEDNFYNHQNNYIRLFNKNTFYRYSGFYLEDFEESKFNKLKLTVDFKEFKNIADSYFTFDEKKNEKNENLERFENRIFYSIHHSETFNNSFYINIIKYDFEKNLKWSTAIIRSIINFMIPKNDDEFNNLLFEQITKMKDNARYPYSTEAEIINTFQKASNNTEIKNILFVYNLELLKRYISLTTGSFFIKDNKRDHYLLHLFYYCGVNKTYPIEAIILLKSAIEKFSYDFLILIIENHHYDTYNISKTYLELLYKVDFTNNQFYDLEKLLKNSKGEQLEELKDFYNKLISNNFLTVEFNFTGKLKDLINN